MATNLRQRDAEAELNLPPGFRFHPTDEELVVHYLCRKAAKQSLPVPIIAEVDLYKFDPWQLPEMAMFGNKEWYFFTQRNRKYPNGSRPNRAAGSGYWKATGADKPVTPAGRSKPVGIKKALVFYSGKAPKGFKSNWIMHEYRLADANRSANKRDSLRLDNWVLCRLYNKKNDWKKDVHQWLLQQSSDEDILLGGKTADSFGIRDSQMSPVSDLDNDTIPIAANFDMQLVCEGRMVEDEEEDWFMDLNLEEIANELFQQDNFLSPCFSLPVLSQSSSQMNSVVPF